MRGGGDGQMYPSREEKVTFTQRLQTFTLKDCRDN